MKESMKKLKRNLRLFVASFSFYFCSHFFSRLTYALFFISLLFFPLVFSFGVSPASGTFPDISPGESSTISFLLSSPFDSSWKVSLSGSEWYSFSSDSLVISQSDPSRVFVTINVPNDALPGDYFHEIFISYSPENVSGEKQSVLVSQLRIPIQVHISGERVVSCNLGGLRTSESEINGMSVLSYTIKNTGTTRITPKMYLFDDSWFDEIILPGETVTRTHAFSLRNKPADLGENTLLFSTDICGSKEFSLFISENIVAKGTLEKIEVTQSNTSTKTLIASFRNEGENVVTAKLTGVVLLPSGEIVSTFEGDSLLVFPGQLVEFQEYVDVLDTSFDHTIRAKVLFEGVQSQEKQTVITKTLSSSKKSSFSLMFIFLIITCLLILIISKKKNMTRKRPRKRN